MGRRRQPTRYKHSARRIMLKTKTAILTYCPQRRNNTAYYMFSPSLRSPMASSTRISVATLQPKSHHRKPDASTGASRSPSKASTARRTRSSLTRTSRTPRRKCTSCERSRPSPVSSGKHSGRSDVATPLHPALPNV